MDTEDRNRTFCWAMGPAACNASARRFMQIVVFCHGPTQGKRQAIAGGKVAKSRSSSSRCQYAFMASCFCFLEPTEAMVTKENDLRNLEPNGNFQNNLLDPYMVVAA
ncbi:hypothetical protein EJB05_07856, partial [Eragrostis curvula]